MRRIEQLGPVLLVGALAFFIGCPSEKRPSGPTAVEDAGPPPDAGIAYQLRAVLLDGGVVALQEEPGSFVLVDPTAELLLQTTPALADFRVRLFDEVHRALVSDDVVTSLDGGTDYRIQLASPLKSGHKYTLVVDGQTAPEVTDETGKRHPEYRFPLQVSGEKIREIPEEPPKKKRRRR